MNSCKQDGEEIHLREPGGEGDKIFSFFVWREMASRGDKEDMSSSPSLPSFCFLRGQLDGSLSRNIYSIQPALLHHEKEKKEGLTRERAAGEGEREVVEVDLFSPVRSNDAHREEIERDRTSVW